jgi:hypothetical protein
MSKNNARKAYEAARDVFDKAVEKLSPAEYLEAIDELSAQLESYKECLRDEHPELFE